MVAADSCRGVLAQCWVDKGPLVNDTRGRYDVIQQVQVLGRLLTEMVKHRVAGGTTLTLEEMVAGRAVR